MLLDLKAKTCWKHENKMAFQHSLYLTERKLKVKRFELSSCMSSINIHEHVTNASLKLILC